MTGWRSEPDLNRRDPSFFGDYPRLRALSFSPERTRVGETRRNYFLMRPCLVRLVSAVQRFALRNRSRPGHRCDTAYSRRAWRKRRRRDNDLLTLDRWR